MIKLLTIDDYKNKYVAMQKRLTDNASKLDFLVLCYQVDNAFVFQEVRIEHIDVVLDVGCGHFSSSIQAAFFAKEVYAADTENHIDELLKRKVGINKIKFFRYNAKEMPFENLFFDKVISIFSIEHNTQEDRKAIIKECYRVCFSKQKGCFDCRYIQCYSG